VCVCVCNLLFIISVSFYTSGNSEVNNEDGISSSTALLFFKLLLFFLSENSRKGIRQVHWTRHGHIVRCEERETCLTETWST